MHTSDHKNDREKAVIAKALDAMWAKFLPDILDRVSVLDAAAQAAAAQPLSDEQCEAAKSAAHKLAGTLGTFGLGRGSELARGLEERFLRGGITSDDATTLLRAAAEIRAMIDARKCS